ncbi:hypothetical protein MauCBS54593_003868 [Microsporum audouinii]
MEDFDGIPWSVDLTISPTSLLNTAVFAILLLIKILFNLGPSFEQVFDGLRIYWASDRIRKIKELFQTKNQLKEQSDWIKEWEYLDAEQKALKQRDIFLRETFIEYATKDKLDELDGLDTFGPKIWEDKLADSKTRLWLNKKAHLDASKKMPEGPRIRGWMANSTRAQQVISKIGESRYLAQEKHAKPCRDNGGCCARACGCCKKPRDVSPEGEIYYAHCTTLCLCCIRSRGFVRLDMTVGANVPGFVKLTDEDTFPQDINKFLPEISTGQMTEESPESPAPREAEVQSVGEDFDE